MSLSMKEEVSGFEFLVSGFRFKDLYFDAELET